MDFMKREKHISEDSEMEREREFSMFHRKLQQLEELLINASQADLTFRHWDIKPH